MMRWNIVLNIFLFVVNLVYSQSYIIKFKSDKIDSVSIYSTVNTALRKIKQNSSQPITFYFRPLISQNVSSKSDFAWNKYSIIKFSQKQSEQFLQSLSLNPLVEYI